MCIFSLCCLTAASQCPAFDSGKKTAFIWKWLSNKWSSWPWGQFTPLPPWALQIYKSKSQHRSKGPGASAVCTAFGIWGCYPHRAWNDSENKLKGAGGAAGTSPWTKVIQTCRVFPLYQLDINKANKIIILHSLLLWLHENPTMLLGLCTK